MAGRAVTPLFVVTSSSDTDIPAALSIKVYKSLPSMLDKHFLELHGVSHGAYFRSTEFWAEVAPFMCLATPAKS